MQTHSQSALKKRVGASLLILIVLSCGSGCRPEYTIARYNNGFEFFGTSDRLYQLTWERNTNPPNTCPLVIHLPNKDVLTSKDIASPQMLRKHGGRFQAEMNLSEIRFDDGPNTLIFMFEDDKLKRVFWQISAASRSKYRFVIDGKELLLPLTRADLLTYLGQPDHLYDGPVP